VRLHLVLFPAGGPFFRLSSVRKLRSVVPGDLSQSQLQIHGTKQGYKMESKAEQKDQNPHTGSKTGLNHLRQGPDKTADRGPARVSRRGVRARPTQGRVALAKGKAKLPERPRDEGGPREASPHCLVSQVPEQRQGWAPKESEGRVVTPAQRAGRRTPADKRAAWRRPGQRPQAQGCAQRPQQRTQPPGG
jgi:hypothetical protein